MAYILKNYLYITGPSQIVDELVMAGVGHWERWRWLSPGVNVRSWFFKYVRGEWRPFDDDDPANLSDKSDGVKTVLYPLVDMHDDVLSRRESKYCRSVCELFTHPHTEVRAYLRHCAGPHHYVEGTTNLFDTDKEALKRFHKAVMVCDCVDHNVKLAWTPDCTYDHTYEFAFDVDDGDEDLPDVCAWEGVFEWERELWRDALDDDEYFFAILERPKPEAEGSQDYEREDYPASLVRAEAGTASVSEELADSETPVSGEMNDQVPAVPLL